MQPWVATHFWPAQWLLNGTLVGAATGLLAGWILATWQGKRSREQKILDDLRKIVKSVVLQRFCTSRRGNRQKKPNENPRNCRRRDNRQPHRRSMNKGRHT